MPKIKSQLVLRFAIALVVLGVIGAGGYQIYRIRQEKHNFAQAEADINTLAQQIQDTISQADEVKTEKSCGYASRKFEKGPLGCGVTVSMVVGVDNTQQANEIRQKLNLLLDSGMQPFSIVFSSPESFSEIEAPHRVQRIGYDLGSGFDNPPCTIGLSYAKSGRLSLSTTSAKEENLLLELNCGGPALSKIYPVSD